jgi:hypothetical protein
LQEDKSSHAFSAALHMFFKVQNLFTPLLLQTTLAQVGLTKKEGQTVALPLQFPLDEEHV